MAIIACREPACGKNISSFALSCPYCGCSVAAADGDVADLKISQMPPPAPASNEPAPSNGAITRTLGSPQDRRIADLKEQRLRAEKWVNGYTVIAAALTAPAILPGGATAVLCGVEATMCYHIGKMYSNDWTMSQATAAAGTVGLAAVAGKIAALEALVLLGPLGVAGRPLIAGGIVKTMGQLVIKYFEETAAVRN